MGKLGDPTFGGTSKVPFLRNFPLGFCRMFSMDTEQTQRGGLFVFLQLLFRQALSNGDFAFLGWNDLKGWIFFETRFFLQIPSYARLRDVLFTSHIVNLHFINLVHIPYATCL